MDDAGLGPESHAKGFESLAFEAVLPQPLAAPAQPQPLQVASEVAQVRVAGRCRVVFQPSVQHLPEPHARSHARPRTLRRFDRFLIACGVRFVRFAIGLRLNQNLPCRVRRQPCVSPRKSKASGLPCSPRFRFASASRPNSSRRVLPARRSNPCPASLTVAYRWKRSASLRFWKPSTKPLHSRNDR